MSEGTKRSFKVSPRGIINLASSTLRGLGLRGEKGQRVRIKVEGGDVVISPSAGNDADSVRVSPRGVIELPADAQEALRPRYVVKQGSSRVILNRA